MKLRLPPVAYPLAAAGLALAACVGDTLVDPYKGHGIPCPLHALTGLWCPGCGSARAIYSLIHLDWSAAIARNPLLVVALPYVLLRWVGWMSQSLGGPSLWALPPKRWVAPAVGGLIVAFWVARNLPWPGFRILGPD